MRKLTLAFVAGCMCAAVSGAYAAQGSPADSDKAGRMSPGTSAGQLGATDPSPGKAGGSGSGMSKGGSMGAGASTAGSSAGAGTGASTGGGATSSSTGGGSSAASSTGGSDDMGKGKRSRRARASKG